MLLTAGIIIALVSTYTEIKLVHGSNIIRRLYVHGFTIAGKRIEGIWFNTAGSFFLSWVLGAMFSADGMTVLLGAALSTALSQLYFSGEEFLSGRSFDLKKYWEKGVESRNTVVSIARDFQQPVKDFLRIVLWILRAITFPFVVMRKTAVWYNGRG